ncbi:MAG: hypothetical protein AB9891_12715 [Anaerolineaceae bacterium]
MPNLGNSQSFNRYSFVKNNPIRYNDPSGNRPSGECEDGGGCDKTDDTFVTFKPKPVNIGNNGGNSNDGNAGNSDNPNTLEGAICATENYPSPK